MAIDGIGVWGADAILGEDEGGMSESDADVRLILCVFLICSATCLSASCEDLTIARPNRKDINAQICCAC